MLLSIYCVGSNIRPDGTLENLTTLITLVQIICLSSFASGLIIKSIWNKLRITFVSFSVAFAVLAASYGFENSGFFDRMFKESFECIFTSGNLIVVIIAISWTVFLLQSFIWNILLMKRYLPALTLITQAVAGKNEDFLSRYLSEPELFANYFKNVQPVTNICRRCFSRGTGRILS